MMISTTEKDLSKQSVESEVVLSVNGVSKKFCRDLKRSLFYGVQDMASELVGVRNATDKLRPQEFWALNDVSFELRRGEALGLVGKNGSGKSTLLRIIAGLIKPDAGSVEVKGRVAPLIALGAGFSPVLTGRENIYANMSILGLSKKEIDQRFDQVVEFAEIGDAIDAPVRSYSSGMAARLGFSCAIHTEPDILLIDEVLAVGDAKFRAKCTRKLNKVRDQGSAFILVSHNASAILGICSSAIYLSKGNVVLGSITEKVVRKYEEDLFVAGKEVTSGKVDFSNRPFLEKLDAYISYVCFRDKNERILEFPEVGEFVSLCIGCSFRLKVENLIVYIAINDLSKDNESALVISNEWDKRNISVESGNEEIQIQLPCCNLRSGVYEINIYLRRKPNYAFDIIESLRFQVKDSNEILYLNERNLFYQPRTWKLKK